MVVLPWKRRPRARCGITSDKRAATTTTTTDHEKAPDVDPVMIPSNFICPISLELMKDPVTLCTGITYDRHSIETWLGAGNATCPMTNQHLTTSLEPIPNHTIRKMIQDWCAENHASGVERVPTPKIPLRSVDVLDMVAKLVNSQDDEAKCRETVAQIRNSAKESERNRCCIVENGAALALSSLFHLFASSHGHDLQRNVLLLGEILSAIASILPPPIQIQIQIEIEVKVQIERYLSSLESLQCIVWFMNHGDHESQRRSAVLVLKRMLAMAPGKTMEVLLGVGAGEAVEGLVKLIKKPVFAASGGSSTKAALVVIYHMITSDIHDQAAAGSNSTTTSTMIIKKFIEMRLTCSILELLVDADRSICEKALRLLDRICDYEEGRSSAYHHALTMPLVIKKLLRVSDMASELSVSILWKLCKNEAVLVEEALRLGGFQKLLLLLQSAAGWRGSGEGRRTKEKVTELLRLMNLRKDSSNMVECIDSMDFKDLKRPF
ncbi:hypothetical protein Dimus_014568 [Dionaea muscipula]